MSSSQHTDYRYPGPGERPERRTHPDNLRPEGDFQGREPTHTPHGERAPIVQHPDQLRLSGDFVGELGPDIAGVRYGLSLMCWYLC